LFGSQSSRHSSSPHSTTRYLFIVMPPACLLLPVSLASTVRGVIHIQSYLWTLLCYQGLCKRIVKRARQSRVVQKACPDEFTQQWAGISPQPRRPGCQTPR
jgi:hypothetical protein